MTKTFDNEAEACLLRIWCQIYASNVDREAIAQGHATKAKGRAEARVLPSQGVIFFTCKSENNDDHKTKTENCLVFLEAGWYMVWKLQNCPITRRGLSKWVPYYFLNNLRGDNNFNIAMNRMKAADITQLRYLFDMYLLCIL